METGSASGCAALDLFLAHEADEMTVARGDHVARHCPIAHPGEKRLAADARSRGCQTRAKGAYTRSAAVAAGSAEGSSLRTLRPRGVGLSVALLWGVSVQLIAQGWSRLASSDLFAPTGDGRGWASAAAFAGALIAFAFGESVRRGMG